VANITFRQGFLPEIITNPNKRRKTMPIDENKDHSITLAEATKLTKNYRIHEGSGATLAGAFGKDAISKIIDQNNCTGLRIYYALTDNGLKNFVLCGVDNNGDDLYDGELAEYCYTCPPICPKGSPLAGT
jgi:hypothetical protein